MRYLALALASLFLLPLYAHADTLKNHAAIDQAVQQFMTKADSGNLQKAYNNLRDYLGVSGNAYDKAGKKAVAYFQQVFQEVGKPLTAVLIRREAIGKQFYRVTMLQKYDSAAFAWQFTFYPPHDG